MVAVAVGSRLYAKVRDLDDWPPTLMDEIEQFFINYNKMRGRVFKPTARRGAAEAIELVKRSTAKVAKKKTLKVRAQVQGAHKRLTRKLRDGAEGLHQTLKGIEKWMT